MDDGEFEFVFHVNNCFHPCLCLLHVVQMKTFHSLFIRLFTETDSTIKDFSMQLIFKSYFESRARGADFQVGGLTRTRKREPLGGSGGMLPRENLKYYSSEMARNASKKR